jgi:DNA ligase D-like protein (predicted 3'-phosphoesterase)
MSARLDEYRHKRNFRRTAEPRGKRRPRKKNAPLFVVQRHDASTLHFDFRLEADGVLKSWAVPKGPSLDPRTRRLAVATEDHPLDYADFEGVIEEGQYGAGTVIVWDTGTYRNLTEKNGREVPVGEAIENGHVTVWLNGEKIHGGYALNRFRGDKYWLLVKMRDDGADGRRNPASTQPESVLTGRTNRDLERDSSASTRRKQRARS